MQKFKKIFAAAVSLAAITAVSTTAAGAAEYAQLKDNVKVIAYSSGCSTDENGAVNLTPEKIQEIIANTDCAQIFGENCDILNNIIGGTKPPATEAPDTNVPPVSPAPPENGGTDSVPSVSEYERKVVELVNDIRSSKGLGALSLNEELSNVARIKSQDMKDNKYFSHNSPTYGSPFDMMKSFGIKYKTAGENIAVGYPTPEAVVNGWMNSDGHRENILKASFAEIGVGYVADGNYWTQMFIG